MFEDFFSKVIELCREWKFVKRERIITDSILIETGSLLDSIFLKKLSEPVLPSGEDNKS